MHRRSLAILAMALAAAAILGTALAAGAWEREPLSAFHERRARLIRDTGGDGVVVLFGYEEADVAASVTSFRQNEEFYYLTETVRATRLRPLRILAGQTSWVKLSLARSLLRFECLARRLKLNPADPGVRSDSPRVSVRWCTRPNSPEAPP